MIKIKLKLESLTVLVFLKLSCYIENGYLINDFVRLWFIVTGLNFDFRYTEIHNTEEQEEKKTWISYVAVL